MKEFEVSTLDGSFEAEEPGVGKGEECGEHEREGSDNGLQNEGIAQALPEESPESDPAEDPLDPPCAVDALPEGPEGISSSVSAASGTYTDASEREELSELLMLYPELRLSEIPAEVLHSSLPLAASYALYERKKALRKERAEAENQKNRIRSPGGLSPEGEVYYSPDEVRCMTQKEVRQHYGDILRSMSKWK